jgi:hypothetical protein
MAETIYELCFRFDTPEDLGAALDTLTQTLIESGINFATPSAEYVAVEDGEARDLTEREEAAVRAAEGAPEEVLGHIGEQEAQRSGSTGQQSARRH